MAAAEEAISTGRPAVALRILSEAARTDPAASEPLLKLAELQLQLGLLSEAGASARSLIQIDPSCAPGHLILGGVRQREGAFEEANASFLRAAAAKPGFGLPYQMLSMSRRFDESDEALLREMFEAASIPDATSEDRLALSYALGKAMDDLHRYEDAILHYDEANRIAAALRLPSRVFSPHAHAAGFQRSMELAPSSLLRSARRQGVESDLPIFIVGMIRSGTTLLEQILSSHPEVGAGGEQRFLIDQPPGVWGRLWNPPDWSAIHEMGESYLAYVSGIAPGFKRITDKFPGNFIGLGTIHLMFPNARIIHCRRHPVDTSLSVYMNAYAVSPDYAHVREHIVAYYKLYRRLMQHWASVLSEDRFIEVDYEDIVANREAAARRLLAFCGLDWNEACLSHEANKRAVSTPSVWQARQPIYASSVERWRNYEPWLGAFADLL